MSTSGEEQAPPGVWRTSRCSSGQPAATSATSRTSESWPNRDCSTSPISDGDTTSRNGRPAPYAPCSMIAAAVATIARSHAPHRSRRTRASAAPARQARASSRVPPTTTARARNPSARSTPNTTPTARLPWPRASSDAASPRSAVRDPAAPIWKVKAPCTGCESAETTRHVTTYPPAGRSGGTFSDTALPFPDGWYGSPLSTRRPRAS